MMAGKTIEGLRILERFPYFRACHILDVSDSGERAAIAQWVAERDIALTYCLTIIMYREELDLSHRDESKRRQAVARLSEGVREAAECGAVCAQLISGPAPALAPDRPANLALLQRSLTEIAAATADVKGVRLAIEPLDVAFHKRKTLGSTAESIRLTRGVREQQPNFTLCLDTAHMILNEEDPVAMVTEAAGYFDELHLCNCITQAGHPLYGDYHPNFGPPGRLDAKLAGQVLASAYRTGFLSTATPGRVTGEILRRDQTPEATLQHVQEFLEAAWAAACDELQLRA